MAPRMKLNVETAIESLISNGVIHSEDDIVRLIGEYLPERELEVQWKVIDALKSENLQAACLKNFTTAQLKDLIMHLNKEGDCLSAEKQTYILSVYHNHLPDSYKALMESLKEE